MGDELEDVRAQQAVATGEHQDRVGAAEAGDLVDEGEALGAVELAGQRGGGGRRTAVPAREQARRG